MEKGTQQTFEDNLVILHIILFTFGEWFGDSRQRTWEIFSSYLKSSSAELAHKTVTRNHSLTFRMGSDMTSTS